MLMIPSRLPDEMSRSFLGRIMRINGMVDEKASVESLAEFLGVTEPDRKKVSVTALLAMATQVSTESFVCQHSLIPLRRSITSYYPEWMHGASCGSGVLWMTGTRLMRPDVYLCADCVQADIEKYGMSYWHREHQLPGVLWCARHRVPLRYVREERALLRPASDYLSLGQEVDDALCQELQRHGAVRRFLAIVDGLMDSHRPYPVPQVRNLLRERARQAGFLTYPGRTVAKGSKLLSDVVRESFPKAWLDTVFPALSAKEHGKPMPQVDGVLYLTNSAASAVVYALACCVLFADADEALHELASTVQLVSRVNECHVRRTAISDDAFRATYVRQRGVHRLVARELSVSTQRASMRLLRLGLPDMKDPYGGSIERALRGFFVDGLEIDQAAVAAEVAPGVLTALVRQVGNVFSGVLLEMNTPAGRGSGKARPAPQSPQAAALGATSAKVPCHGHADQHPVREFG